MTNDPCCILVVDDEDMIRINLEAFLEDEGFEVLSAASGEAALEILAQKTADVAIVDMRLPNMDGNKVIVEAKKLHPKMAFMIHTGSSEYNLSQELVDLGMTPKQILLKPLANMNSVIEIVKKLRTGQL